MDKEFQTYILFYCRDYMLPEELRALTRIGLSEFGEDLERKIAAKNMTIEGYYGFQDDKTNDLVKLGKEKSEELIAKRIYKQHKNEIINLCSQCGKLARTPKAKQCRHCGYDWHYKTT